MKLNRIVVLLISTSLVMIALGMAVYARAEDAPKPEPQITLEQAIARIAELEQQLDYRTAQVNLYIIKEQNVAREAAAQKVLQGHVDAMVKVCGDRGLVANAKGNPECGMPKPK